MRAAQRSDKGLAASRGRRLPGLAALARLVALAAMAGPAAAVDYCVLYQGQGYSCDGWGEPSAPPPPLIEVEGHVYQLSKGNFSSRQLRVAVLDSGAVVQTGGANTVTEALVIGVGTGASGSYSLIGGALSTGSTTVGDSGAASFVQLGGLNVAVGTLIVGWNGSYTMGGGSLSVGGLYNRHHFDQLAGNTLVSGDVISSMADLWLKGGSFSVLGTTSVSHAGLHLQGGSASFGLGLEVTQNATLTLDAGTLTGNVFVSYGSSVRGQGGTVNGQLSMWRGAHASFDSGQTTIGRLLIEGQSDVTVGGVLNLPQGLLLDGSSLLTLRGGKLGGSGTLALGGTVGGWGEFGGREITGNGVLLQDGGDWRFSAAHSIDLSGSVLLQGGRRVELQTPLWTQRGTLMQNGALITGSGRLLIAPTGSLHAQGRIELDLENQGALSLAQNGLLEATQRLTNHGELTLATGSRLQGRELVNTGIVSSRGLLALDVTNQGELLLLDGRGHIGGRLRHNGGLLRVDGGGVAEVAAMSAEPGAAIEIDGLLIVGQLQLPAELALGGPGQLSVRDWMELNGNGIGQLSGRSLMLQPGLQLRIDLAPGRSDHLSFDQVVLGGTLLLRLAPGLQLAAGDRFDLFGATQVVGAFSALQLQGGTLDAGLRWDLSSLPLDGTLQVVAVPEPGSLALWLAGGLLLVLRRRRRHDETRG